MNIEAAMADIPQWQVVLAQFDAELKRREEQAKAAELAGEVR